MRAEPEIAQFKLWFGAHTQARAIAIVPGWRGMQLEVGLERNLGDATEGFLKYGGFDLQLVLVGRVLVVAAAATQKIGTAGIDPRRRRTEHFVQAGSGELCLLLHQFGLYLLTFEHEWNEDGLPATALVWSQARQAVATVDEFFDCEVHRSGRQAAGIRPLH